MGGNQITAVARLKRNFQKITAVESQNGATVGFEIADAREVNYPGDRPSRNLAYRLNGESF